MAISSRSTPCSRRSSASTFDELICLGDVSALGPQPREVIERLRTLRCPVVMGNTDAWHLDPALAEGSSAPVLAISHWCTAQLTADDLAYVRTYSPTVARTLPDGTTLLCVHGSPRSFDDAITATTPDDTLDAMLDGTNAAIMVGGHTHIQMLRRHRGCDNCQYGQCRLTRYRRGQSLQRRCPLGRVRGARCRQRSLCDHLPPHHARCRGNDPHRPSQRHARNCLVVVTVAANVTQQWTYYPAVRL